MEEQKPNWKQWIPIYGVYKIHKDDLESKPSYLYDDNVATYHAASAAVVVIGLLVGLEKLLH